MTLVCVPIMVGDPAAALADAAAARDAGADIVEFRIDSYFDPRDEETDQSLRVEHIRNLIADAPLPVILTCRSAEEGGDYDAADVSRVELLEAILHNAEHPPAYLDFELAAYQRSPEIRDRIDACLKSTSSQSETRTRLILSMHDFDQRPSDLMRRLAGAWAEPAASVVKFAYRCRSIRDNLEIFEILRDAPKPTIGLGMGEFGLMSRVLAPKFNGFLTFASLRDSAATAPGQPTISDLLGMYRIRSITKDTEVYGVIGWPVTQSMSPLIHNAGFEARGWDGVYLPMPVPDSDEAFKATLMTVLYDERLVFAGASVTIPHKQRLAKFEYASTHASLGVSSTGAANTLQARLEWQGPADAKVWEVDGVSLRNTDAMAIKQLVEREFGTNKVRCAVFGAGGVARGAIAALAGEGHAVEIHARSYVKAINMAAEVEEELATSEQRGPIMPIGEDDPAVHMCDLYINCTPVGMTGGPDPEGLSIPVHDLAGKLPPETVFFDTVYNPIETPMLKAAREHGFRTIDGVEMFVRQAAAQFEHWTGEQAPLQLFDRLVRERLGS
ncbi:MAG: type I 3-dehydroquinate dehydratase [Planctomycetota bacterium]